MRLTFVLAAFLFSLSFSFSSHAIFLRDCKNTNLRPGEVVSWQYERCIENNFWYLEGEFDNIRFERCDNWPSDRVGFRFTRCIQDNFRELTFALPTAFVRHCFQNSRDELEPRFVKCVNDNFERIEREVRFGRHRR